MKIVELEKILSKLPTGIAVLSEDGSRVMFMNEKFKDILKKLDIDVHRKEDLTRFFRLESFGTTNVVSSAGKVFGYSVYKVDNFYVISTKDISEKEYRLSLEREKKEVDLINYLFTIIRHEIGNPINTIKFTLSVMEKNLEEFKGKRLKDYIARLMAAVEELEKILTAMKNYSQFGRISILPVDLTDLVKKVVFLLTPTLRENQIDLVLNLAEEPLYVKGDPTAIKQVLMNVFKNSIEAFEDTNREKRRIKISSREEGKRTVLTIEDNGKGIKEELKEYLFFPFFSTKKSSSGMGLAICKGLMTAMGGKIIIESQEGEGTAVNLVFLKWKEEK